jgi:hypothetical protein
MDGSYSWHNTMTITLYMQPAKETETTYMAPLF